MKAMFGVVSLLVVLAIVGLVSVRQMRAVQHPVASVAASAPGDVAVPQLSGSGSAAEQSRDLQKQVTDDIAKAMQQGAARNQDADK